MDDETLLVFCLLGGVAVVIPSLIWYSRRQEADLAAREEIEIPVESMARGVLFAILSMLPPPILVGVVAELTDPWMRDHALGAVLWGAGGGLVSLAVGYRATRRLRRIGRLLATPERLQLDLPGWSNSIDLTRPFALVEAGAIGPAGMRMQVVSVRQGNRTLNFSYGLLGMRQPHGDQEVDVPLPPLLDGTAAVVHDRLRAAPTASTGA